MFPQSVQPLIKQGLFRPGVCGFPPQASCPSHWTQSWPAGLSCQLPLISSQTACPGHWGLGTSSPQAPLLAEGRLPAAPWAPALLPSCWASASASPLLSCPRGNFSCCLLCTSSFPALCCAPVSLSSFAPSPGCPQTTLPPPESHVVRAPRQSARPPCASVADPLHNQAGLVLNFPSSFVCTLCLVT